MEADDQAGGSIRERGESGAGDEAIESTAGHLEDLIDCLGAAVGDREVRGDIRLLDVDADDPMALALELLGRGGADSGGRPQRGRYKFVPMVKRGARRAPLQQAA